MAAIIEFSLPTDEFALQETLSTHPEAQIEIERVIADDPEQITPYVWVRADFDAFEATLERDPTVEEESDCCLSDIQASHLTRFQ